jgi:ferritin-like protein
LDCSNIRIGIGFDPDGPLRKERHMGTVYNESGLSQDAQEVHRALASLIEELEAVDWYNQRVDVTKDENLKAILAHNRDEEMEHAAMALEWLRRKMPRLDEELRTYLFTSVPITEIEEGGAGGNAGDTEGSIDTSGSLGIGK